MRVAVLAPISWRVPPRHYGPWEFVSLLTEGLVARGVDVTLFATGDPRTAARLSWAVARGWSEDGHADAKVSECLHVSAMFERAGEFDLIHNSFDFLPLTYSALVSTPALTTIHGFSSPAIVPVYEKYNGHGAYVAKRRARPSRSRSPGGWACPWWPGSSRISATTTSGWARTSTATTLNPNGSSKPMRWSRTTAPPRTLERRSGPMACGTPVVAFGRGSMPELIDDGRSGFLVADVEGAADAVAGAGRLDRAAIRHWAVDRFGADRMTDDYLAAYSQVLARAR